MANSRGMRRLAVGRLGFTLVELLVVIGIIAVLISILLPALSRARAMAQKTVCLARLHQVGLAWVMYTNDNKGWVCPMARYWCDNWQENMNNTNHFNVTATNPISTQEYRWFNYLYPYTKNYTMFNCPTLNLGGASFMGQDSRLTQVRGDPAEGGNTSIAYGYSWDGISSNYAYSCELMGRYEIPTVPSGQDAVGLDPSYIYGLPKSWMAGMTPAMQAAWGPKNISTVMGLCRAAGVDQTKAVVAMCGAWWAADTGFSDSDSIFDINKYCHMGKTLQSSSGPNGLTKTPDSIANAVFIDGHAESGRFGNGYGSDGQPDTSTCDFQGNYTSGNGLMILYKK